MAQARGDTWWTRTIGDENAATILSYLQPPQDANIPQTSGVVNKSGAGITSSPLFMPLIIGVGLLIVFLIIKKIK